MKKKVLIGLILVSIGSLKAQVMYTLSDCRQLATQHNKELMIAGEKVKAAASMQKAAKTYYLPQFSASGGYVRNQKNLSLLGEDAFLPVYAYSADGSVNYPASWSNSWTVYNGSAVPLDENGVPFDPASNPDKIQWKYKAYMPKEAFEFDIKNVYAGSVLMTQPLFMGGKIVEMNRLAESSKKLAEAELEGTLAETLVNTDVAYWRIVSLVKKEELARQYVNLLNKLDSDVQKSIKFGASTTSEGLTVKVKMNEAEMALLQAEDGLRLSKMALCQLCGLPLRTDFVLSEASMETNQANLISVEDTMAALENRYEIKSLHQAVNMAASNKKIMASRFLPNAVLTAGYSVSNPNVYNGYSNTFGGAYQVGVAVSIPVFHWGERVHTLQSAKREQEMADLKLEDAKEKIELDITQATFKQTEAEKKQRMASSNQQKAEENLRYATVGFKAGAITSTVLMEAQTAWMKACSEYIDATIDIRLCEVTLQKAMGLLK
jgi:outer membrane protein